MATVTEEAAGSPGTYTIVPRTSSNVPRTGRPTKPTENPTLEWAASTRSSRNVAGAGAEGAVGRDVAGCAPAGSVGRRAISASARRRHMEGGAGRGGT